MTTTREGSPKIDELLRNLGEEPLLREAEAMGLAPRNKRMRCPFPGCADKGKDRERDAQIYAGHHPRIFCFACQGRGDLVDLLQLARGWNMQEAIAHLTGIPVASRPPLQLVHPPEPESDRMPPAEVKALWDSFARDDERGRAYLEGRGLDEAIELGLVRFATESIRNKRVAGQAGRGYRAAALLTDVVGNPRGIQLRCVREVRAKEPKILSVTGSAVSRAWFGHPELIEAEPIVAVAEGLADTLAVSAWARGKAGVVTVGAAGKDNLPKLAEELEAANIPLTGKLFALFVQNDRPENKSRRQFQRLGQALTKLGARAVLIQTHEEFKDVADWRQTNPDVEWPPAELARAILPEPGDDTPRAHTPTLAPGCAVPIPQKLEAEFFAQDFTTLCALLDDPMHRESIMGPGELTWNEMTGRARLDGREIAEVDLSAIRLGLERQHRSTDNKPLKFSEDDIAKSLKVVARRKTVHPVRDWLMSLKWDGHQRMDVDLPSALGQPVGSFAGILLTRWLISAVARPINPGCKVDTVLVLVGGQGAGKSTFFNTLAGDEWFTDSPVNVGDTDGKLLMREKWIVEWAELDAMRRARDKEAIRAFLSQRTDHFREPYGRGIITAPRGCVIVGTTNNREFLSDFERRFLPVEVNSVDLDWVRANRDQLLAEAVARYRNGEQWYLHPEEVEELSRAQQEHRAHHPWHEIIEDWLLGKGAFFEVTVTQILVEALNKPQHQLTQSDKQAAANVLAQLGWERRRRTSGGSLRWVYVRPGDAT